MAYERKPVRLVICPCGVAFLQRRANQKWHSRACRDSSRGWPTGKKTAAKYRTPEHRAERERLTQQMARDGHLVCAQPVCVKDSRVILPGMKWHVGHADNGVDYIGPVHKQCNERDGAVRGSARAHAATRWRRASSR